MSPITARNGRNKRHQIGWLAIGYSKQLDLWFSSEGVFNTADNAIADLQQWYGPFDFVRAVKVSLVMK